MSETKRPATDAIEAPSAKKQVIGESEKSSGIDITSIATPQTPGMLPSITVTLLSGKSVTVQKSTLPRNSTVGDLMAKISENEELGYCFSLMAPDGQILSDPASPLPEGEPLLCVMEDVSGLCEGAQRLLTKTPFTVDAKSSPSNDAGCRLGPCRWLGEFKLSWEETVHAVIDEDGCSDIEEEEDRCLEYFGRKPEGVTKDVYELTLLDGEDKHIRLIAIIREGFVGTNERITYHTGMSGPIYLRPGLQEVGQLTSRYDERGSFWKIKKSTNSGVSWYKEPQPAQAGWERILDVVATEEDTCQEFEDVGGGSHASTVLTAHLALALSSANGHKKEIVKTRRKVNRRKVNRRKL